MDYTLAVFSNGSPNMLEPLLENAGLKDMFHHVITVDDVQTFKPSPSVYEHARQKTGFNKKEILFLSSNTWDIAGAKNFGFQTAWINRNQGVMDELGVAPDFEWRDLTPLKCLEMSLSENKKE
jgi:2-haloacid dehalogenase